MPDDTYTVRLEVVGPDGRSWTIDKLVAEVVTIEVERAEQRTPGSPFGVIRSAPVEVVRIEARRPVPAADGTVYTLTERTPTDGT